jgi:hypothetical protein
VTPTPPPQCEDCSVRPIGSDARCAWCIVPGRYRRDPFPATSLPPWLSNTEVDRSRRRSTIEAILRTYQPEEVNWSAVAALLGVSRQAVHQLKRRIEEAAARPPDEALVIHEALEAALSRRRSNRHHSEPALRQRTARATGMDHEDVNQ